jgi:hypothetical protein
LATQRAQNTKSQTGREPEFRNVQQLEQVSNDVNKHDSIRGITSLPPEVALFLIERYFSHHWNATLMFHKQNFTSDYLHSKIPGFLLLSIFAIASKYMTRLIYYVRYANFLPSFVRESSTELGISSSLVKLCNSHGREWAKAAGQLILTKAEDPCLESIQASQNLAFYWFYVGEASRCSFYTSRNYLMSPRLGVVF